MITKNFILNAAANRLSAAVYESVRQQNGGDWFPMTVDGTRIEVAITGGVNGIRDLVESYVLKALKENYPSPQWETIGIALLNKCLDGSDLNTFGADIWESMVRDMESTVAGGRHA